MASAVGIYIEANWLCHTNGVGHLYEHFVGNTCSYRILGDVTCCVSSATVYLAGVLSTEGAAAVCAASTISIDDNFATRQTCVSVRSANHELASWIDVQNELIVKELLHMLGQFLNHAWQQDVLDVVADAIEHLLVGLFLRDAVGFHEFVVLSTDDDGVDAHWFMGLTVIFHCYLTLCVGTQIRYQTTLAQCC